MFFIGRLIGISSYMWVCSRGKKITAVKKLTSKKLNNYVVSIVSIFGL